MMKCPSCGNEFIADADTALGTEGEEKLKWVRLPPLEWVRLPPLDEAWKTIPDKGERE